MMVHSFRGTHRSKGSVPTSRRRRLSCPITCLPSSRFTLWVRQWRRPCRGWRTPRHLSLGLYRKPCRCDEVGAADSCRGVEGELKSCSSFSDQFRPMRTHSLRSEEELEHSLLSWASIGRMGDFVEFLASAWLAGSWSFKSNEFD